MIHGAVVDHLELCHELTGGDDCARVLAGTADDDALEPLGVVNDIGAGQEAAHAVAEQKVGYAGVFGGGELVERVHIAHDIVPAVLFCEKAQLLFVFCGLTMAKVVIRDDDETVFCEKLHKRSVTVDMLGDAMRDLQDGAHFAVGRALSGKYVVFPISGQKPKIMKRWHSNTPYCVIY